jgi:hypothetical protein
LHIRATAPASSRRSIHVAHISLCQHAEFNVSRFASLAANMLTKPVKGL